MMIAMASLFMYIYRTAITKFCCYYGNVYVVAMTTSYDNDVLYPQV